MTAGRSFVGRLARSSAAAAIVLAGAGLSAWAASPSPPSPHPALAKPAEIQAPRTVEPDATPRNAVARARMLECGHQWSSQKKNGTASGTWKDFSRGCLAQR